MEASGSSTNTVKPLSKWMRLMLLTSSILPFLAGLSLFVGTSQTEDFAAWTINSEITAATIGAAYWAGLWLTLLAGLERTWARARVAVAPVLAFSLLNLIAVLLDLDIFHTDSDSAGVLFVTYLWLVPYFAGPLLMAWLLAHQLRIPGGDPPREDPLSPAIRAVLVVQGVVLVAVGAALFIAPVDTAEAIWPWEMKELSGRVIGIWLVSFAAGVFAVLRENDYSRSRPAAVSYLLLGLLEFVVLLRYTDEVSLSDVTLWAYMAFLVSFIAVGGYVVNRTTRRGRDVAPASA